MNQAHVGCGLKSPLDRIEGDTIILDGQGSFPKKIIIIEPAKKEKKEYRMIKTHNGGYVLNK
jgi:hypothetical protein